MSLVVPTVKGFSLQPTVRETNEAVIIRTGLLTALLTLFLRTHRVKIVPVLRKIFIRTRTAWFFKSSKQVDFRDISHVDYSYESYGTDYGITATGVGRHDEVERFSVSVVTNDRSHHFICSFRGDGAVATGWTGMLLGNDEMFDIRGSQESESRKFAMYLAKLLGVTIGKPVTAMADMATCPACKRPTSLYKPTCLYCGAAIEPT